MAEDNKNVEAFDTSEAAEAVADDAETQEEADEAVEAVVEVAEYVYFAAYGVHHSLEIQLTQDQLFLLWSLASSWLQACTRRPRRTFVGERVYDIEAVNGISDGLVECNDVDATLVDSDFAVA